MPRAMGTIFNYPTLVAALDGAEGLTSKGFSFMDRDKKTAFVSFDGLRTEAMRRAAHFRSHGLKAGDRLALVLPDGDDFVPTFLAAVWAGIVPVPLYPPLSLGKLDSYLETLVGILSKSKCTHLVTNNKLQQVIWSGLSKVKTLQGVILAEDLKTAPPAGFSQEAATVGDEDLCFLQFTSGSTSLPKGVAVTHGNLRANAWAIMRDGLKTDTDVDKGVSWLPLYHDMGLIGFVIAPVFHRVSVTFIPTMSFVRSAPLWLETMHKDKATISFAPNFAYALATKRAKPEQLAQWDLSHVRHMGCGAEPINASTIRAFVDTFSKCGLRPTAMLPAYGMAEATLAISFIGVDEALSTDVIDSSKYQSERRASPSTQAELLAGKAQEFVSCGQAFPGHEVGIFSDEGKKLKDRSIGEIWVKGPSIAKGYYEDVEASAKSFVNGWLKTGDFGYLVQGEIFITGRKKDIIIINGRNYDPQRMEWLVDEVPDVRKGSAVAFSRPGSQSEELIIALESRSPNSAQLIEAVKQKINEHLQLMPAEVVVCAGGTLPKTSSGKIQRSKTREQFLSGTLGQEGNRSLGYNGEKWVLARHVALSLLGRAQHRAKRVVNHTLAIRSVGQAVEKMNLVKNYAQRRLKLPR
jgi:fatty-acyl-CoA synthase